MALVLGAALFAQLQFEGFRWQMIPLYLAAVGLAVGDLFLIDRSRRVGDIGFPVAEQLEPVRGTRAGDGNLVYRAGVVGFHEAAAREFGGAPPDGVEVDVRIPQILQGRQRIGRLEQARELFRGGRCQVGRQIVHVPHVERRREGQVRSRVVREGLLGDVEPPFLQPVEERSIAEREHVREDILASVPIEHDVVDIAPSELARLGATKVVVLGSEVSVSRMKDGKYRLGGKEFEQGFWCRTCKVTFGPGAVAELEDVDELGDARVRRVGKGLAGRRGGNIPKAEG